MSTTIIQALLWNRKSKILTIRPHKIKDLLFLPHWIVKTPEDKVFNQLEAQTGLIAFQASLLFQGFDFQQLPTKIYLIEKCTGSLKPADSFKLKWRRPQDLLDFSPDKDLYSKMFNCAGAPGPCVD